MVTDLFVKDMRRGVLLIQKYTEVTHRRPFFKRRIDRMFLPFNRMMHVSPPRLLASLYMFQQFD
jgi:hypothetical protein